MWTEAMDDPRTAPPEGRAEHAEIMGQWLLDLAEFKRPPGYTSKQAAAYGWELAQFPVPAVREAIDRHKADDATFCPAYGQILATLVAIAAEGWAGDRAPVLPPDEAWRLACRATSRYQPQTRPTVASGNPAVDGAVREVGGGAAFQCADMKGHEILRGRFLDAYRRQSGTTAHLAWALRFGPVQPVPIAAIELTPGQIAAARDEAAREGLPEPAYIARALSGAPGYVPDGTAPPQLPSPALRDEHLTPERRAAVNEDVRRGIARVVSRLRLPADTDTTEAAMARRLAEAGMPLAPDAGGDEAARREAEREELRAMLEHRAASERHQDSRRTSGERGAYRAEA